MDYRQNKHVLIGLGEYLALRGSAFAEKILRRLDKTTLGTARVVLLLRCVTQQVNALQIDDSSFQKISRRSRIDVFDDVKELRRQAVASSAARPKKKGGLLSAVAAFAAGAAVAGHLNKKHDGHCDGDCANCPPHFGYRYGRWYYGKGHQYGCEFGGNKGDGSL